MSKIDANLIDDGDVYSITLNECLGSKYLELELSHRAGNINICFWEYELKNGLKNVSDIDVVSLCVQHDEYYEVVLNLSKRGLGACILISHEEIKMLLREMK